MKYQTISLKQFFFLQNASLSLSRFLDVTQRSPTPTSKRRDLLCNHSNGDLFTCENKMLLSLVKISCFRATAHLVFHRCLYNKKRGFKLASLNVHKLSTHIDEIRILLADKCLDVLAIQETKLDVCNNNSDFYICGYVLIRRDRLSDGGGGICFYMKSTINFSVWTDLNVDELENLCIEIRKPNSKIGIGLLTLQLGYSHIWKILLRDLT